MALTISQNSDCSLILVTSELLDTAFGGSPDPYTDIKITIYRNCCDCDGYDVDITRDAPAPFPTSETDVYLFNGTSMELNPKIIDASATTWTEGVYKIIVTLTNIDGTVVVSESNCFFLDCATSCQVAKHIKSLLKTDTDTDVHLLHFGLTNGSNCNCNCDEMCYLYRKLYELLNDTEACLCCK